MSTWSGQVGAGLDDVFRRLGNSAYITDGKASGVWNAAGRYDATNNKYGSGLRFTNVTIPQGATISAATLTLKAKGNGSWEAATAKTRIRAQAADNPGTFVVSGSGGQTDFDGRILTSGSVDAAKITTSVDWDDIATNPADGTTLTSPDISAVIQAIVNRSGWASGNAIVLFWDDFDGRGTSDYQIRFASDYEESAANAPTLSITYTTSATKSGTDDGTGTDASSDVRRNLPVPTIRTSGSPTQLEDYTGDTQGGVGQNHNAFPGMCKLPNGNVLIAYQKAYTHGGINGGIWYTILAPDGSTVTAPTVLSHAGGSQETPTMSDGLPTGAYWSFGDVQVKLLANGEVMVHWFERRVTVEDYTKVWARWLDTSTMTWSARTEVTGWQSSGTKYGIFYTPEQMPNGTLLAPVYEVNGYSSYPTGLTTRCVKSTDNGRTWTNQGTISSSTSPYPDETAIHRFSDGQLIAIQRCEPDSGIFRRFVSNDDGATWTLTGTVISTFGGFAGISGCPKLLEDSNGTLWVCGRSEYGSTTGHSYHVVFYSGDRGRTWSGPIDPYTGNAATAELTNQTTRGWCVYGDFCQLNDGNVAHVWAEAHTYTAGPPYLPETSALYYRVLTQLGTDGTGSGTGTEAGALGLTTTSSSETGTGTDASSAPALTAYDQSSSETGTGTDATVTAARVVGTGGTSIARADDFSHNGGSDLTGTTSTGTGSDGSAWLRDRSQSAGGATPEVKIITATGQARANPAYGASAQEFITLGADMATADYSVEAVFKWVGDDAWTHDAHAGVLARYVPAPNQTGAAYEGQGYSANWNPYTGAVSLLRYLPASGGTASSVLTSVSSGYAGTVGQSKTIRLTVAGNVLTVYVDGAQVLQHTDNDGHQLTAAGRTGFQLRFNAAGVTPSDSSGVQVDSFRAGAQLDASAFVPGESDSGTGTEGTSLNTAADSTAVSGTETGTGTDSGSGIFARVGGGAATITAGGTSQGTGVPQTIIANSGSSDGLNYNAFPGMALAPAQAASLSGSASKVMTGIGFNGACRCANGDLLVVGGYGGTDNSGPRYAKFMRSTNGGVSWVDEGAKSFTGYPTATDGYDCWALSCLSDGTIIATTLNTYNTLTTWYAKSTDHGATFTTPVALDPNIGSELLGNLGSMPEYRPFYGPMVESTDGTGDLLCVFPRLRDVNDGAAAGTGMYAIEAYCCRSSDKGATWHSTVKVADSTTDSYGPYANYDEPLLVRLGDGRLGCFMRTQVYPRGSGANERWTLSYSSNEGATWSQPIECMQEVGGHPQVIAQPDGVLVAAYRYHGGGFGTSSGPTYWATSTDHGATWTGRTQIGVTGNLSCYGQMVVTDPTGQADSTVAAFFGEEGPGGVSTGTAGVYMQKFARAKRNLVIAYHHANDHIGSGTNKLYVQVGVPNSDESAYTWGAPQTLTTLSGTDVADVGMVTLPNRTLMVTWNESTTPGHATINTVVHYKRRTSSDGGSTWAAAVSGPVPGFATEVTAGQAGGAYAVAPCDPIVLRDGSLLLAPYGWDNRAIEDGGGSFTQHEYVKCMRSTDNGNTWTQIGTIFPDAANTAYDETALLLLDDGSILAASRCMNPANEIRTSRSTDNGVTWSAPVVALGDGTANGWGGRPSLIQTENGGVLLRTRLMYANASSWTGYRFSADRGATWGAGVDPYTGGPEGTGAVSSPRGMDIYGAFSKTGVPNRVAYAWCEEVVGANTCAIYFRLITVTSASISAGSGGDVATGSEGTPSLSVQLGLTAKSASESGTATDTAGSRAVTAAKSATDTGTGTDGVAGQQISGGNYYEAISLTVRHRAIVGDVYSGIPGAPVTSERVLTDAGRAMLEDLPSYYWTDPVVQAACNALGNELKLLNDAAVTLRGLASPQLATEGQLPLWEALFELPTDTTVPIERRRGRVLAMLRSSSDASGTGWANVITTALGTTSWSYVEGPADYTLTITLPYSFGSTEAEFAMGFIRRVTPANLALAWDFGDGFVLGVSAVGVDTL